MSGAGGTREVSARAGLLVAVRALVLARDGRLCSCCGAPTTGRPFSILRRSRRAGDSPVSLLTFVGQGDDALDPDDHCARVESGIDPSDQAKGYAVPSWKDPVLIPVLVYRPAESVITVWLTADGEFSFVPPAGA